MRFWHILLLTVLVVSLFDISNAAKDRKKKKQQQRNEDSSQVEDRGESHFDENKNKEKETKERVHALVERQEEKRKEKEEESSEERDDEKDKNNGTEIVIPKRIKRNDVVEMTKAKELNDGAQLDFEKKPYVGKTGQRFRRSDLQEIKRSKEINDGAKLPVGNKPKELGERKDNPNQTEKPPTEIEINIRFKRSDVIHSMKKSSEVNDGVHIAIENPPKVNSSDKQ